MLEILMFKDMRENNSFNLRHLKRSFKRLLTLKPFIKVTSDDRVKYNNNLRQFKCNLTYINKNMKSQLYLDLDYHFDVKYVFLPSNCSAN